MEELFMNRLMGGAHVVGAAVLLLCLFGVMIFRPQRIRSPFLFRVSYMLLAVSLVLPSIIDALVQMASFDRSYGGITTGLGLMIVSPLFHMIGHILFGVSMLCGFGSLRNRGASQGGSPMHIPPADQ